jgi:hypothetical protein
MANGERTQDDGISAPEPPFGAADPDPFMPPTEAAQVVRQASRDEIGYEAATRELERALAEGRLSLIGIPRGRGEPEEVPARIWAHHELAVTSACTRTRSGRQRFLPAWVELRFRRKEVLALWPEDALTRHEACAFLAPRLGADPFAASSWLLEQVTAGKLARSYATPITSWAEGPLPLEDPSGAASSYQPLPHTKHWRFRRNDLVRALAACPSRAPWRTRVPEASGPDWTTHTVARAAVASASGYDRDTAADWLLAHTAAPDRAGHVPAVRARIAPRALAERERKSAREKLRAFYPSAILDETSDGGPEIRDLPGCCGWHGPRAAFPDGGDCEAGFSLADVEWHATELRAAIAQGFATRMEPFAAPSEDSKAAKRGPKRKWEWEAIVAEAAIIHARAGGTLAWKQLAADITELARRQTGKAPQSDSTSGELATLGGA